MRQQSAPALRRIAIGALLCLAVVLAASCVALMSALSQKDQALERSAVALRSATAAVSQSDQANRVAGATLGALASQALALCQASGADRAYVDAAHRALHAVLLAEGRLQLATGLQLERGISRGVHAAGRLQVRLGRKTIAGAGRIKYLAPVNCGALTANPAGYVEPTPRPFKR